jgi:hypothetical protein
MESLPSLGKNTWLVKTHVENNLEIQIYFTFINDIRRTQLTTLNGIFAFIWQNHMAIKPVKDYLDTNHFVNNIFSE